MLITTRISCALFVLVALASPSGAWIYDGGAPQHLGVSVKDGTSCAWVAEPFQVQTDCYATSLGAAIARAIGPVDAGFTAYLATMPSYLPGPSIAKLTQPLVPLNTQYVYTYGALDAPVLLHAGVPYALVLRPSSPSLMASVSWSVMPGSYYGLGTGDSGVSWYRLSWPLCVRVDGYAVPESTTLAGLGAGLLPLLLRRRR